MKAVLGALILATALCIAVMIHAGEAPSPVVSGPVAAPLGRPHDRSARLEYPDSNATGDTANAPTIPQPGDLFSKFSSGAASPQKDTPESNRPLRFPAVYAAIPALPSDANDHASVSFAAQQQTTTTSDPARGAPSNHGQVAETINAPSAPVAATNPRPSTPPAKAKAPPWRPIQVAFKQFTAPTQDESGAAPATIDSTTTPNPIPAIRTPPQEIPSVKVEALPPWKAVPASIDTTTHPSQVIMADGSVPLPGAIGYAGGPRVPKSECGYCSPAPPFGCCTCQSVREGGPGCNCGSNGICANCGGTCGGETGGCSGGCGHGKGDGCGGGQPSNWVNGNGVPIAGTPAYGSCVLQRLACCLCAPYPDCSNGCVDFCHSWIFHEDCHWCTSNHKCCNPGCPESPHGGCSNGTGGGCGCGCGCSPCVPPPDLYGTADALILTRNNDAFNQPLITQSGTGATLLSTGDIDFVYEVGPSITLGYRPTPWDAWEISYFGLMDWDSRQSLTGAADLNLPGALGAALDLNFSNADAMNVTYSSVIHNGEFNYLWTHGQIMWLLGFRYFHLGEELDILSTGAGGSTAYDITTRNDLYGGQIGARYRAGWRRFNWDFFGKAGVFGNRAVEQQLVSNVGGVPIRDTSVEHGNTAFVGDIGVNFTYQLSKCWSIRGGYNAIWIEDVALAPNQLDFTDTLTSGETLNTDGSLFMHGAHAGFGCRW